MSTGTYVTRRSGTTNFSARVIVPLDLRDHFGRSEIWKSLATADKREAIKRSAPVFAKYLAEFDAARRTRPATEADLKQAAYEHYVAELEHDRRDRAALPKDRADGRAGKAFIAAVLASGVTPHAGHLLEVAACADPLPLRRQMRSLRRKLVGEALATGETDYVEWAADAVIKAQALDIAKGSAAYIDLCQRLQRAELEALKRAEERDVGEWGGTPADPAIMAPAASQKVLSAKPGESVTDLFEAFYRENAGSVRADTWGQNRMVIGLFSDHLGRSAHVTAVTRKAISGWKQQLRLWPVQAANTKDFDGLDFKAVIAKNAVLKKPTISDKTINRYLSGLGKFCKWLLANGHLDADVMQGQYLGLDKSKAKVLPYSAEQVRTIFASPLFAGCKADNREHLPGDLRVTGWRRWIPFLAAYSGARLGELCQLMTADVRKDGDTWVMHVTSEGEGDKKVKTKGSQRVVPLHPIIIASGFLDFHAAALRSKQPRLFPEVERDTRGHFAEASRYFNRYFGRIGVKTDSSLNFHSLRHSFIDACRKNYLNAQIGPVVGHGETTMTERYGRVPQGVLKQSLEIVSSVAY